MPKTDVDTSANDDGEPIELSALPLTLSATVTVAYFVFILMVALNKPLMGAVLIPGISVGVLSTVMLLALCIAASGVFVAINNRDEESV
jgi:uncharacterized membrane protein (DUF485 family)